MKYNGQRNKNLPIKEYLEEIISYLKDIINDLEKFDSWKFQLTIAINFISSKDIDEECIMHWKKGNIEVLVFGKADEVIEELFELLLRRYQIRLERWIIGHDFIFDSLYLLYYKCHKINFESGRSYRDSSDQITNRKAGMNPTNDGDKSFQYAATITLNSH